MFKIIKTMVVEEYKGKALLYRDDRTGMEVFHVKNDSSELCCAFIFGTPSEDSKGTAHILEHTVLCGSERYPVKDPFSQIYLSSPNTFLNAITFCDKTMYPFASPLKKDFDNIFDVYADAVFAPLLRKESFEQEGIRAFGDKFDGVVFNEMTGALSTEDSAVETYCCRKLFENTPCAYESGGEPYFIADLTYEEYLARYRKWYSPSNCRLFLFGNLNADEYISKLEERYFKDLSKWDNVKITVNSEPYMNNRASEMRDVAFTQAPDANSVVMTWLTCPSDDVDNSFTASFLVDMLLGSPSSPLYRAITESKLGDDLSQVSGINTEYPVLTFTVGFVKAKHNSEDEIEKFILDTFKGYVKNGFDKSTVETALKRQEFKVQEITGDGFPFGLGVCLKAARTWMRGSDPFKGILELEKLKRFKQRMQEDQYLEKWIERFILKNRRRCLLTVKTDGEYQKKIDMALDVKLEFLHKNSTIDWKKEKDNFESFLAMEDSPQSLELIPRITIDDIPPYKPLFSANTICSSPFAMYSLAQHTRGIVYLHLAFDCSFLTLEEKKLFPLLLRVLQMCGTKKTDWVSFGNKIRFLTGSFSMTFSAGRGYKERPVSNLIVRTKMLKTDTNKALEAIRELLTEPDFSDAGRIKASMTDIITDFESSFIDSGSSYASLYSASKLSPSSLENELTLGVSSYLYIRKLREKFENGYDVSQLLEELRQKIISQCGMKIHISCDSADMEEVISEVSCFAKTIPMGIKREVSSFFSDFTQDASSTVLLVSNAPAYNAMSADLGNITQDEISELLVLGSVLSNGCLWNSVRGRFGAYSVECHVDSQEKLFLFSSYRDPMVDNTYLEFEKSLEHKITQKEKDFAVITVVGKELKPYAPWGKSSESFRRLLYGITDSLYLAKREHILSCSCNDIEKTEALVLKKIKEKASRTTVCGADMKNVVLSDSNIIELPI